MRPRDRLARLLAETAGLTLERGGVGRTLDRFVESRLEALGLGLDAYLSRLQEAGSEELRHLLDVVTVPHTWFFRDREQLEVISELLGRGAGAADVWIPGCASGEDAYTLALLAGDAGRTGRILGTDINSGALAAAQAARYGPWSVRDVPAAHRAALRPLPDGRFEVDPDVRARVGFLRHNVLEPSPTAPSGDGWELILCRNLLIYFVRASTARVLQRFVRALRPGGHLVLGASDAVVELPPGLRPVRIRGRLVLVRDDAARGSVAPSPAATERRAAAASAPALRRVPAPGTRTGGPRSPSTVPLASIVCARPEAASPVAAAAGAAPRAPATPRAAAAGVALAPRTAAAAPEAVAGGAASTQAVAGGAASTQAAGDALEAVSAGNDLLDAGDPDGALAAYGRALAAAPDCPEALLFKGIALQSTGRVEEAAEALRGALFLDPRLWPAAFYLALCYDRLYRHADAVRQYRHLLEIAPHGRPLRSRGRLASELGSWRRDVLAVATERCRLDTGTPS